MLNSVDFSGRPFHFIGIGGIGMSALAYILAKRKLPVSGSDIRLNHITQRLQDQGAHIFWSQDASNLNFFRSEHAVAVDASSPTAHRNGNSAKHSEAVSSSEYSASPVAERLKPELPQVICSTAIDTSNSEYRAALELGCPIFHRSDLLAALMRDYSSIAVAGTHGKTTTSSMIGHLLLQTDLDPTIVVGGEVAAWGGNAHMGKGPYLVAEADESDGSLVKLAAQIGVITNMELDHPDHYTTLDDVIATFKTFAQNCRTIIGCIDCETVRRELQPDISYSLRPELKADYMATDVSYSSEGTIAQIWERGQLLGPLKLKLLGQHNLSNALAAVAVGRLLGLEFPAIATSLETFEGACRRYELRGEHNQIQLIDDYAHHPSEVQATLAAARLQASSGNPPRRVVAIFQPHRYSRTLAFLPEFARSFGNADLVVTTEIYSAGEAKLEQVSGEHLANAIAMHHSNVVYQPSLPDVYSFLIETLTPGDLVLFLGAGNLNQVIPQLNAYYQQVDRDNTQTHVAK